MTLITEGRRAGFDDWREDCLPVGGTPEDCGGGFAGVEGGWGGGCGEEGGEVSAREEEAGGWVSWWLGLGRWGSALEGICAVGEDRVVVLTFRLLFGERWRRIGLLDAGMRR